MVDSVSASSVIALKAAQTQQGAAQVGVKLSVQKDQEIVGMLEKAQDNLQAVTPTRGNNININV